MSQTSIGRAALVLTTNGSGLRSGLDKEGQYARSWANRLGSDLAKKGGGLSGFGAAVSSSLAGLVGIQGGLLGTAGTAIGAAVGGPIGAAIGGAIGSAVGDLGGKAFGALSGAAQGAAGLVVDTMSSALGTLQDLGKQGSIASAIGLTAEQFTGISGVAKSVGEDTREFIESLVTMGKLGTDAANGTEEASKAFQALGLNAKEFIKLRADEQFFKIFESIGGVPDKIQQTRLLMAAFGEDGGKYLLPLLEKTPTQLREMAAGFAVSGEEMKRAQATTRAWGQLGTLAEGVWRRFAGMLSGPLELIANGASLAVRTVGPVFDWMDRTIRPLWDAGREGAELLWEGLTSLVVPAVQQASAWFDRAFASVTEGVSQKWPSARDLMLSTFRGVGTAAALTWDSIRPGAAVIVAVAAKGVEALGILVHGFRNVIQGVAALGAQAAMAIGDKGLAEAFHSVFKQADQFGPRIAALSGDFKRLAVEMRAGAFGESAVQFNAWLDRMLNRTKAGAAEVKATAAVASAALKKFDNAALLKGTSAEVTARLKYDFGGQSEQKQMVAEQKRGNGLLGGILGAAQAIAGKSASVELAPL